MAPKAPDAFRTISEVADWLGVSTHVLRFWESKFPQIKPVKRAGGRRYYRPADMELLGGLRKLLHDDGLTVKGAQKVLREQGIKAVSALSAPIDPPDEPPAPVPPPRETEVALTEEAAPQTGATETDTIPAPADPAPEQAPSPIFSAPLADLSGAEQEPAGDNRPTAAAPLAEEPVAGAPVSEEPEAKIPEAEAMPLFSQRRLPESLPENVSEKPVDVPETAETAQPQSDSLAPQSTAAEHAPVALKDPRIAPLPDPNLTLAEYLARLMPGQIRRERLLPIHARLTALRDRMDADSTHR